MNLERLGYKAKKTNSKKWLYAGFDDSEELLRWLLRDEDNAKYDPAWIDRKTICQCTGLKDSDGKLIYENDYLSIGKQGKDKVNCVVYSENSCSFEVQCEDGVTHSLATLRYLMEKDKDFIVKVVGNKFDEKEKPYVFVIQRPVITYEQICVEADSEDEALKIAEDDVLWDDAIPDDDNYEVLYDQVKIIDKEQFHD